MRYSLFRVIEKSFHIGMRAVLKVIQYNCKPMHCGQDKKMEYATAKDFCSVFHRGMASLYQLAFLLAADHHKAQQIFAASLEECLNGNSVFRQRIGSWAKRVIVTTAVRVLAPACSQSDDLRVGHEAPNLKPRGERHEAITRLSLFTRFVFVMTVLERFSVSECAVLLRCAREEIVQAQSRAVVGIALGESARTNQTWWKDQLAPSAAIVNSEINRRS